MTHPHLVDLAAPYGTPQLVDLDDVIAARAAEWLRHFASLERYDDVRVDRWHLAAFHPAEGPALEGGLCVGMAYGHFAKVGPLLQLLVYLGDTLLDLGDFPGRRRFGNRDKDV